MQKGVSIFYIFHEQGMPHKIAGIYSNTMQTEDEMRVELLSLLGYDKFSERDQPIYVNHTHVYAKHLLGEEIDKETENLFKDYFPAALNPEALPTSPFKFVYYDGMAYNFIWDNRYKKQLREYRQTLLKDSAKASREKRRS